MVDNNRKIAINRANGYEKTASGLQNAGYRSMSTDLATGDMLSTVRDLYLWDRALYNDKLLSARFREIMFRPNTGGYGYGWSVNKIKLSNGRILRTVSHTG
ncbi:MAG TPA: hypothetical protein VHO03_11895, partial [Ignavibacteriales bacterium]|nr:hypothetical protein [Ignavibacteriales bacterium]